MKTKSIHFVEIFAILSLLSAGFSFSESYAAGFIKFDGIDGESADNDHYGWSDLGSISRLSEEGSQDLVIEVEKEVDKATPKITEAVVKGKVFPKVEIEFTADDDTFLSYELTNVLITSYQVSGDSNSRPVEEIHLHYEKINQNKEPAKEPETTAVEPVAPARPTEDIPATEFVQARVPTWVQTTASFWVDGDVSDREFTDGIGYLVKERVIQLDEPVVTKTPGEPTEPKVPSWIKQNVDWWIKGQVPEDQFLESIKWLIQNNIITGVSN